MTRFAAVGALVMLATLATATNGVSAATHAPRTRGVARRSPLVPRNYQIVTNSDVVLANEFGEGFADCPKGTVTYGGGVSINSTSTAVSLQANGPRIDGKEWHGWVDNESSATVGYTDYAICARKGTYWNLQFASAPNPTGGTSAQIFAFCNFPSLVVGGGSYGSWAGRALGQTIASSFPVNGGSAGGSWDSQMNNNFSMDGTADSVAICGKVKGRKVKNTKQISALPGQTTGTVWCPAGKVPLSGGVQNPSFSVAFNLGSSYPVSSGGLAGWTVTMNNTGRSRRTSTCTRSAPPDDRALNTGQRPAAALPGQPGAS